jgi:hypothetical protein
VRRLTLQLHDFPRLRKFATSEVHHVRMRCPDFFRFKPHSDGYAFGAASSWMRWNLSLHLAGAELKLSTRTHRACRVTMFLNSYH